MEKNRAFSVRKPAGITDTAETESMCMAEIMKRIVCYIFTVVLLCSAPGTALCADTAAAEDFPMHKDLELRVQFWINIFTKYTVDQWVLHDSEKPEIVYSVVSFPSNRYSRKERLSRVKAEKERITEALKTIQRTKDTASLSGEHKRLYRLLVSGSGNRKRLYEPARVRAQQGMRETFRDGLVRSGSYIGYFKKIFSDQGLPLDLVYLPHVESSFNPEAKSRSGARGMWQFTRTTGRQFLTICRALDERDDPFISAEAAAAYLRQCYEELESWPLAITAYNHGLSGMRRAAVNAGSDDIAVILKKYRSRRFGFASKNFYTEFLAARHVVQHKNKYFPEVKEAPLLKFRQTRIHSSQPLDSLAAKYAVSREELIRYNPALCRRAVNGTLPVPGSYRLRLPLRIPHGVAMAVYTPPDAYVETPEKNRGIDNAVMAFAAAAYNSLLGEFKRIGHQNTAGAALRRDARASAANLHGGQELRDTSLFRFNPAKDTFFAGLVTPAGSAADTRVLVDQYLACSMAVTRNRVTVYPEETLGHYADWLNIPTWKLRLLNRLQYGQAIQAGQHITLDFSRSTKQNFQKKRLDFHENVVHSYLNTYTIDDSIEYKIRPGDTLWNVARTRFDIPVWLVYAFNTDKNLARIQPGELLKIPVVKKKAQAAVYSGEPPSVQNQGESSL